jgi:hypothetical protein
VNSTPMSEACLASFALCLRNDGYPASLEVRKAYTLLPITDAEKAQGLLRVVDESGDDYLYPSHLFLVLDIPFEAKAALGGTT